MEEVLLQQRVKYLVEHGGVYPEDNHTPRRTLIYMGVLIVLEVVQVATLLTYLMLH